MACTTHTAPKGGNDLYVEAHRDRCTQGSHSPDSRFPSPDNYERHFSGLLVDPVLLGRGAGTVGWTFHSGEYQGVEDEAEAHS